MSSKSVQFAYTILYVKDVKKSLSFYEKAFGLKRKFVAPGDAYGELATGATTLAFGAVPFVKTNLPSGFIESSPAGKPFGIEVAFTTDDVEKTFNAAIAAGAVAVEKAKTKPWGQTVAYIKDIDGFLIEICTPVSDKTD